MAKGMIYMVDGNGALTAMSPSAPPNEDRMQSLVAKYPELITDDDGDLLLIRREHPIADSDGSRWSVDHLFVTRTGIPVLVELKRAVDTRLRREVVGQMLDYAANATAYWQSGQIAQSFAQTAQSAGGDPDEQLAAFLGERDPSEFWSQVDANFVAGRIKIVFVADLIPPELARIVEFLNDQMRADVRAVELRWFASEQGGTTTLSPRIIGESARTNSAKAALRGTIAPIGTSEWIEANVIANGRSGAYAFVKMVEDLGGEAAPTRAQYSMYSLFRRQGRSLYPLFLTKAGGSQIQLRLDYLMGFDAFRSEAARQDLLDKLSSIVGELPKRRLSGFPPFPVTVLNDPKKVDAVGRFLADLVERAFSGPSPSDV